LDLTAGAPSPETGVARVDVSGASDYLTLDLTPGVPLVLCIHPLVPVSGAGVLDCDGGSDFSVRASQNHNLGVVGEQGFTEGDCAAAGGVVESAADPHAGVCNGPVAVVTKGQGDSGSGALFLAPDPARGTVGLRAEVTVETALPCGDEGPPETVSFGFVSGRSAAEITNANNQPGVVLAHEAQGENFSCPLWGLKDGPGRLLLSIPALHGLGGQDVINVFVLDDR